MGATLDIQGNAVWQGNFNDQGTLQLLSGVEIAEFDFLFSPGTLGGTVIVQATRLRLIGPANSTAAFQVTDEGLLELSGGSGTHALMTASSITTSDVGSLMLSGGIVTINGTLGSNLDVLVDGATVNFNAPSTLAFLEMSNGTLQGTASLTVNGFFSWSGGTIGGNQTLTSTGNSGIFGAANKQLARTDDQSGWR